MVKKDEMDQYVSQAVTDLAGRHDLPVAHLKAFVEVESAGRAFWLVGKEMRPAIRIEGHYFYRLLSGAKRDEAVRLGLAAKKAGAVKNPVNQQARYEQLDRMKLIDEDAAYKSISIGLGQVMIEHYKRLGFVSPKAMYDDAFVSAYSQVEQMVKFIITDKTLYVAVQRGDWPVVQRIYNGPASKDYGKKMAAAAGRYGGVTTGFEDGVEVDDTLTRIQALGHSTVKAFQKQHGLRVDGIVGPITLEKLDEVEAQIKTNVNAKRNSALKLAGTALGGSAAVLGSAESGIDLDRISQYASLAQQFAGFDWRVLVGGVVVVGVTSLGYAAFQWWKNRDAPVS